MRCGLLLWIGCLLGIAGPALAGELDRTFPASPEGTLVIASELGSVDLITHDRPEVRIEAISRGVGASGVRFATHSVGDAIVLEAESEPWLELMRSIPGVRIRAWVPVDFPVELRGGIRAIP